MTPQTHGDQLAEGGMPEGAAGDERVAPYCLTCHLGTWYLPRPLAPPSAGFNESEKNYEVS